VKDRPPADGDPRQPEDGIHEWSYDNGVRSTCASSAASDKLIALKDIKAEVELGFATN